MMRLLPILLLAAAAAAQDRPAPPWEKSPLVEGRDLYRENCVVCHDIDNKPGKDKKLGPSFYHVFPNGQMPVSKAKPNRGYIMVRSKFGGKIMPAFRDKLTDAQINLIIDYIESK